MRLKFIFTNVGSENDKVLKINELQNEKMEGRVWSCRAIPYIKSTQNFKNRFPNYTNNYPNIVYFTQSINKFLLCFSQYIHILTGTYLIVKKPLLTSQMPFVLLLLRFIDFNIHIITRTGDRPYRANFRVFTFAFPRPNLVPPFFQFSQNQEPFVYPFPKNFSEADFQNRFSGAFPRLSSFILLSVPPKNRP